MGCKSPLDQRPHANGTHNEALALTMLFTDNLIIQVMIHQLHY